MSTIKVENLTGITSGANANKIIVPAGQTLDASNGFIAPAGHILQTLQGQDNTFAANTSSSYIATNLSLAITPKYATSKILVTINVNGVFVSALTTAGSLALYADSGSGYASLIEFDNNLGYAEAGAGRIFGNSSGFQFLHDINTTNATTYKVYLKRATGSGSIHLNNYAVSNVTRSSIVCQEIAQ